jgi:low temperature requirement protein LtrA
MVARDPEEPHRSSTPLELFFDLTFVVAVAAASSGLQHGLGGGRVGAVAIGYPLVFFAVWWPWMNFSWFASAYGTEDVLYRLAVLVQMAGVLIVAIGIPKVLTSRDFSVMIIGYVVMRLAMVGLWFRAAAAHPAGRSTALRYGIGVGALQVAWVLWAVLVPRAAAFWVLVPLGLGELAVPIFAEAAGRTSWHHAHIAERYSLFTIIVLGETLSAGTIAVGSAFNGGVHFGRLASVSVGALLIAFAMWWLYFDMPLEKMAEAARRDFSAHLYGAFRWGYGHYLVFAGAAATGAGVAVSVARITAHSHLSRIGTALACTVPVACYLLAVWVLHAPFKPPTVLRNFGPPVGIVAILLSALSPQPVLLTGLILAVLVVLRVIERARTAALEETVATDEQRAPDPSNGRADAAEATAVDARAHARRDP